MLYSFPIKVFHAIISTIKDISQCRYRDEILNILRDANEDLSELLYPYAKMQLEEHQVSLENRYKYYQNKLAWLEEQIELAQEKRLTEKCNKCMVTLEKCEQLWGKYGERLCSYFDQEDDALCYSIDCYLDTFYSMIEHLFVLLTPFHPQYDPAISEEKQPEKFKIRCRNWVAKAEALAFGDEEMLSCIC